MTPQELDAIRARDAGCSLADEFDGIGQDTAIVRAYDRRALLAEVERLAEACQEMLSAMLSASRNETTQWALGQERARIRAAVEGLAGIEMTIDQHVLTVPADFGSREFSVPPVKFAVDLQAVGKGGFVDRAAVLAAVSGEAAAAIDGEDEVYIGPIQHSNAQCWSKDDPTCHCWCAVCERHNR